LFRRKFHIKNFSIFIVINRNIRTKERKYGRTKVRKNESKRMNSQPVSDLGKFGAKMDELFNVLGKAFPDDTDLPKYEDKLKAARKINPRMVCEKFMELVKLPHHESNELFLHKIMREDDAFFLGLNHSEFVCDPTYLQLLNKVTTLWTSMTQSSQNAIKRYMQILCIRGAQATKDAVALSVINQHRYNQGLDPL
jgi:hypothetical protein